MAQSTRIHFARATDALTACGRPTKGATQTTARWGWVECRACLNRMPAPAKAAR